MDIQIYILFEKLSQVNKKLWVLEDLIREKSRKKDYLILTDVAEDVQDIIAGGPVPKHIKPIWPFISFTAFNTLPSEFKNIYGIKKNKTERIKSSPLLCLF